MLLSRIRLVIVMITIDLRILLHVSHIYRGLYRGRNDLHPLQPLFNEPSYLLYVFSVLVHLLSLVIQFRCLSIEEAVLHNENEVEDYTCQGHKQFYQIKVVESTVLLFPAQVH